MNAPPAAVTLIPERVRSLYRAMFSYQIEMPTRLIYERRVRDILRKLQGNRTDMLILDAGCGDGRHAPLFPNNAYVGIDVVNYGFHKWTGGNTSFCVGEIGNLPFEHHSFDLVFCSLVLQHVEDTRQTLCSLHRVLKPGGTLFISTASNWARLIGEMPRLFWHIEDPTTGHAFHYFDREDLSRHCRDAGFQGIQHERIDGAFSFLNDLIDTFLRFLIMKMRRETYSHSRTSTDVPKGPISAVQARRNTLKQTWRFVITPVLFVLKWLLINVEYGLDTALPLGISRTVAITATK
jgi:ubiquinone/menaquinone biosynthesis C-methylase UbiE